MSSRVEEANGRLPFVSGIEAGEAVSLEVAGAEIDVDKGEVDEEVDEGLLLLGMTLRELTKDQS